MIRPKALTLFIKRRLIIADGLLLNPESIAEDVFYLLKAKLEDKTLKPSRLFFTEHVESLLKSYGERLSNIEAETMLFHEVNTLFSQSCEGEFMDTGKSSFAAKADGVDQDTDNETDFMLVMGSTEE